MPDIALDQKEFLEFYQKVHKAHLIFCVWMCLNNEAAKPDHLRAFKNLCWVIIFPALQNNWIILIASTLEPAYFDMKKKQKPNLSLDYIVEKCADPKIDSLAKTLKSNNASVIESIQHHRLFIAHGLLNRNRRKEVAAVGNLFDDLEKIIVKIGHKLDHGIGNDSLYQASYDDLGDLEDETAAYLNAERLFEALQCRCNQATRR